MIDKSKPFAGVLNYWWIDFWGDRKFYHGVLESDARGRFGVGTPIRTSYVVAEDDGFIETRNSIYKLGTPNNKKDQDNANS